MFLIKNIKKDCADFRTYLNEQKKIYANKDGDYLISGLSLDGSDGQGSISVTKTGVKADKSQYTNAWRYHQHVKDLTDLTKRALEDVEDEIFITYRY